MSDVSDNPLADRRVRGLLGFVEAVVVSAVGIFYFQGVYTWLIVGLGVVNMIATTYVLGRILESGSTTQGVGADR